MNVGIKMSDYNQIEKLLKDKTRQEKVEFCNQCLEEPEKYTKERIFALKEYLNNLGRTWKATREEIRQHHEDEYMAGIL